MKDFLQDIISKVQLDAESFEVEVVDDSGRYWTVEGESKIDGVEERYFIYDCTGKNQEFDYASYAEKMKEEEGISRQIIVFKNWEHEWELREKAYKELKKAADKKQLLQWFEEKTAFYTELNNLVELDVEEDGVNYLQYESNSRYLEEHVGRCLKSRVYNVSFAELKKIFNVTGKDLFRKNVRYGLRNNRTGNDIQVKFKEYVRVGAYIKWLKEHPEDEGDLELKKVFEIEDDFAIRIPENFWFYHNGVTIFYYGSGNIDFSGSHIKLNPKEVSVINGAQTLTNFFEGIKALPEEFAVNCLNVIEEEITAEKLINFLKKYILVAMNNMKVKTIFIDGSEAFVQPITYGLNTQIPIVESDIIADSDAVQEINKFLRRKNMKIKKSGEADSVEVGLSVLEFVKKYLIVLGMPGKSKNLRRTDLNYYIQEAKEKFDKGSEKLLEDLYRDSLIEMWWKESKKDRENKKLDENEKLYMKNGKNYFESFVLSEMTAELDEEYMSLLFENFIKTFMEIKPRPMIQDFKKDDLFKEYCAYKAKKGEQEVTITENDCEQLREYLNETKPSPYTIQKSIIEFLNMIEKGIPYFRVIACSNLKVREAFPFPNVTFSELYQGRDEFEQAEYKSYETSSFGKEVSKVFPVFIINWRNTEDNEKGRIAESIKFFPEFSFKRYSDEAKLVYNQTIQTFIDGNEEEFTKVKDGKAFHVRPKAANAEDTFEFTNGKRITRRTFWANKNTMDDLIESFIVAEQKKGENSLTS